MCFERYTKFELYQKNQSFVKTRYNPFLLVEQHNNVICDVYVKYHKKTGIPKFKYVEVPDKSNLK